MLPVALSLASKTSAALAYPPTYLTTASLHIIPVSRHYLISSCKSVHHKSVSLPFGTLRNHSTRPGHISPYISAQATQYHRLQLASQLPNRSLMASQAKHSMHNTAACRAYVGESTPAAAEYHCNDFDWEELKQEAEALLADRHAQHKVSCRCVLVVFFAQLTVMCPCRGIASFAQQTCAFNMPSQGQV